MCLGLSFGFCDIDLFVRPNVSDSSVTTSGLTVLHMFSAPMQLVSSVSLPRRRFTLLAILVACDLKLYVTWCLRAAHMLGRRSPAHASGCFYASHVKTDMMSNIPGDTGNKSFSIAPVIPSISNEWLQPTVLALISAFHSREELDNYFYLLLFWIAKCTW